MSNSKKYFLVISLALLSTATVAQKDVKWTEPMAHPCFYGLKISVLNMGYQDAPKAYLWGVRITNKYRRAVTFRYRLVVGSEANGGYGVAWKLAPGASWTEGGDVFTGNRFQSPSANWKLTVSQVCFDEENCGGTNECYAECDRILGNEYQPCDGKYDPSKGQQQSADIMGTAEAPGEKKTDKGFSGEFEEWRQEGKEIKLTIGQDNNGIYWKKKENESPVLFKNIRPGTYRYEAGSDFFIIKFESDNRISFWNNGSLLGYFIKPEEKKNETVKKEESKKPTVPENKVSSAGNESITIEGDYWHAGTALEPLKVKIVNGGINISGIYDNNNASFWKKIGDLEYQSPPRPIDGITSRLKFINSNTFITLEPANGESNAPIITSCYSKGSLWSKAEKWINNNPADSPDYLMLYINNDGLYQMFSSDYNKLNYFHQKVGTDVYRRSENPDNPNYFAVIYKITSPTTLTIEYTGSNGQVQATKFFTKASK